LLWGKGGGCRGGDLTEGRVAFDGEETVEGVEVDGGVPIGGGDTTTTWFGLID